MHLDTKIRRGIIELTKKFGGGNMKYKGQFLKEISFPLGGIGSGCIGLAGDGRLIDWEIFNRPSKGSINGYSHFAIRAIQGEKITAAVLNGDITKDIVVNESPFEDKLSVFNTYMLPLAKYIDNIHDVINPKHTVA